MLLIYIISLIVSALPLILYITTDIFDEIKYADLIELAKLSFILAFIPAINTMIAIFIIVVVAFIGLTNLTEKIK